MAFGLLVVSQGVTAQNLRGGVLGTVEDPSAAPVSATNEVRFTLRMAVIEQGVKVRGEPSSVVTQPTATGVRPTIIATNDLETIALDARSFAYLTSGTKPVEPCDPMKARITAVSTAGGSGRNNELSVDGGNNAGDYKGRGGAPHQGGNAGDGALLALKKKIPAETKPCLPRTCSAKGDPR